MRTIPPGTDALEHLIASLSEPSVAAKLGRPINSVLVEGGPKLLSLLLQRDLVDIAHVFQSGVIGGGQHARLMSPPERLSVLSSMNVVNTAQIKTDVLIELANEPVKDMLQLADVSAKAARPELIHLPEPLGDFINV
ncbi:dihydrofolate reductase family protein [Xanthomonas fragariae]|uniref:dihydrofolate reductase family protein n=1 Tax=Xanthomonas fragariae TaxID=48664 RepID=UPI0022AB004E|nr:dihydrofolate reductase family protein [Xanthomonas fragariae]WAT13946.1 dihydrofolate reductase family protein [Xanthomonas fragariae]